MAKHHIEGETRGYWVPAEPGLPPVRLKVGEYHRWKSGTAHLEFVRRKLQAVLESEREGQVERRSHHPRHRETRQRVTALIGQLGYSDIAAVLGLSRQRVNQMTKENSPLLSRYVAWREGQVTERQTRLIRHARRRGILTLRRLNRFAENLLVGKSLSRQERAWCRRNRRSPYRIAEYLAVRLFINGFSCQEIAEVLADQEVMPGSVAHIHAAISAARQHLPIPYQHCWMKENKWTIQHRRTAG